MRAPGRRPRQLASPPLATALDTGCQGQSEKSLHLLTLSIVCFPRRSSWWHLWRTSRALWRLSFRFMITANITTLLRNSRGELFSGQLATGLSALTRPCCSDCICIFLERWKSGAGGETRNGDSPTRVFAVCDVITLLPVTRSHRGRDFRFRVACLRNGKRFTGVPCSRWRRKRVAAVFRK